MLNITKNKQRQLYMVDARKIGGKRKGFKDKRAAELHAKTIWLEHQNGNYIVLSQQVTGKYAIDNWKNKIKTAYQDDALGESEKKNKLRSANRLSNQNIFGKRFKDWNLNELISGDRTPYAVSEQIINGDITINHGQCNKEDCENNIHCNIPSSINGRNHYLTHFKQFFDYCVAIGYMNKNPVFENIKERKNKKDNKAEIISPDNMQKVLDNMDKKFQIVMEFAMQTGVRQGEQRALMWKHIDFEKEVVSIEQAMQLYKIGDVKTSASFRTIPLAPDLIIKLKLMKIEKGIPKDNDYVFTLRKKTRISEKSFLKYLYKAIDKAGLERFRWHDLRHYFASILFNKFPKNYDTVTNLLGHTSIEFTRSRYVHWFADDEQRELVRGAITDSIAKVKA